MKYLKKFNEATKNLNNDNDKILKKLEDFNIFDLDDFEYQQYSNFSKSMSKTEALQILINNVEGDYSQLSPKLARIAKEQEKYLNKNK